MSHAVAICFEIEDRGFIRDGYYADMVLVDLNKSFTVKKENILYKCGWSPLEEYTFPAAIIQTFVNGNCVYTQQDDYGKHLFDESVKGQRISFSRY